MFNEYRKRWGKVHKGGKKKAIRYNLHQSLMFVFPIIRSRANLFWILRIIEK